MTETHAVDEAPHRLLPEALRGTHRVRQRKFITIYAVVTIPAATVATILFVYAEQWPPAILWGVVAPLPIFAEVLRRRERIELQAEGVTVHRALRPRRIAWSHVEAIHAPGRWRDEASIDLAGQQGIDLRGVDEETARRLVRWFDGEDYAPPT